MNKFLKIAFALALGVLVTGCYDDFDNPAPAKVYTDEDFTETAPASSRSGSSNSISTTRGARAPRGWAAAW